VACRSVARQQQRNKQLYRPVNSKRGIMCSVPSVPCYKQDKFGVRSELVRELVYY
jgi:hypothetical protein